MSEVLTVDTRNAILRNLGWAGECRDVTFDVTREKIRSVHWQVTRLDAKASYFPRVFLRVNREFESCVNTAPEATMLDMRVKTHIIRAQRELLFRLSELGYDVANEKTRTLSHVCDLDNRILDAERIEVELPHVSKPPQKPTNVEPVKIGVNNRIKKLDLGL